jgi:cell division protein FtsI (penicillin-binding protein 3)
MEGMKHIRLRANVVYLMLVLFGLAIAVKLFTIQLVEGDKWLAKAGTVATAWRTVVPERGNIFSEDGRMLATSVPVYDVYMDMLAGGLTEPLFSDSLPQLAECLASVFPDRSATDRRRALADARARGERYHLIKRRASFDQVQQLRSCPLYAMGRFKSGLIVEKRTERRMPFGRLAKRTVGYVHSDGHAAVGLEGGFDEVLHGTTGRRLERRLAGGAWMPVGDEGLDPVPGSDIHTTIDINLQDVADDVLERQLRKHNAQYGCVVVMEVATGDVKAISNLTRTSDSTYVEDFNYAVGQATEPGSTFKLPALMVGLEDGLISVTDTVDTRKGVVQFHKAYMRDSKEGGYGRITLRRAFEVSSNTGISVALDRAYGKEPQRFVDGLRRMGLHRKLGVPVPGEPEPVLRGPDAKEWSGISLPWMSIGYETMFTPLQILAFYNAVANDGKYMRPRFVERISRNGRTLKTFEPEVINGRICSPRTLGIVRELLQGVVDSGTATNLRGLHLTIAGKTGTAQVARNGSYKQHGVSYQASFVGYFPADKPLYSCIVVVNGPTTSGYYGNVVAGPVFQEIAEKIYSNRLELQDTHLAARRDDGAPVSMSGHAGDLRTVLTTLRVPLVDQGVSDWASTQAGDSAVTLAPRQLPGDATGLVPDVRGMGLRDALYLLENRGLQVRFSGTGMVRRQSLRPGDRAPVGSTIVIELA